MNRITLFLFSFGVFCLSPSVCKAFTCEDGLFSYAHTIRNYCQERVTCSLVDACNNDITNASIPPGSAHTEYSLSGWIGACADESITIRKVFLENTCEAFVFTYADGTSESLSFRAFMERAQQQGTTSPNSWTITLCQKSSPSDSTN